jgi:hypothetical protein
MWQHFSNSSALWMKRVLYILHVYGDCILLVCFSMIL